MIKRAFFIGLTLVTLGLTLYSYKLDKAAQKVKQEPYTTVIKGNRNKEVTIILDSDLGTDTVKIDTNFNVIK